MTTVTLIGNFVVSYTTETYLARALRECGCDVIEVSQDDAFRVGGRAFGDALIRGETIDGQKAERPDLVVYVRTHNATALKTGWEGTWRRLEEAGTVTASVHLDRFWDLERENLITDSDRDALFTTGHVFTADGGNEDRFAAAGVNHHWMPPAVDRYEAEELPGRLSDGIPDIVFTGSGGDRYHAAYPERGQLLAHLHATYGDRFAHFGHGGDRPVVRQQSLNDVYASAKVVVGDSCFGNQRDGAPHDNYWSDRIPETMGRSGVLLHPWVAGIREQFGGDVACYTPGDWDDLDARIGELLANPGERERLRIVGKARVLGPGHGLDNTAEVMPGHTYTHRMRDLLDTVGLT